MMTLALCVQWALIATVQLPLDAPPARAAPTAPAPAEVPFETESRLHPTSPKAAGRPFEEHLVHLTSDQRVVISAASADFDIIVELYRDGNNALVARDDDGGGAFNSRLLFTSREDATYRVRVLSFAEAGQGSYRVSVRRTLPLPPPVDVAPVETSMIWREIAGQLREPGDSEIAHPFVDHLVSLSAGEEILLRAESESIDVALEILRASTRDGRPLDRDGRPLDVSADGGPVSNSVVVFRPREAGDYVVRVRAIGGETGPYRLRVGRSPSSDHRSGF